jgi:inner membrane transporter RhtA
VPGIVICLTAMLSVQLGNAASIGVFDEVGPFGASWLRLCWASVFLLAWVRPRLRTIDRRHLRAALMLGVATGVMSAAYAGSLDRLPLGTASALEFLGPLGVALAMRGAGRAGALLPAVAAIGVLGLTEPWRGTTDGVGVALALVAAGGWAGYIVLTQRVGALLPGLTGLALSFPVAAIVTAPLGLIDAGGGLAPEPVARMAGIALLLPLLPFTLELIALRRIPTAVFGILMCLEPAVGLVVGLIALDQQPRLLGLGGLVLVVLAGVVAQRERKPSNSVNQMIEVSVSTS